MGGVKSGPASKLVSFAGTAVHNHNNNNIVSTIITKT